MSGSLAAALILGGTAISPRGIIPPAPDGVTAWTEFLSADSAVALRNLRNPSAPFTMTGAPTLSSQGVTLPGDSANYVTALGQTETVDFGVLALMRLPAAPSATHRIFSNYGQGDSGVWVGSTGSLAFALSLQDTTAGNPNTLSLAASGWDWTQWTLVAVAVNGAGATRSIHNLSAGTVADFTNRTPHLGRNASSNWRLGTTYQASPSTPGAVQIGAISFWTGYGPSAAEIKANAALMRQRAVAKGLTVALAA